jgi:hypothetical protein
MKITSLDVVLVWVHAIRVAVAFAHCQVNLRMQRMSVDSDNKNKVNSATITTETVGTVPSSKSQNNFADDVKKWLLRCPYNYSSTDCFGYYHDGTFDEHHEKEQIPYTSLSNMLSEMGMYSNTRSHIGMYFKAEDNDETWPKQLKNDLDGGKERRKEMECDREREKASREQRKGKKRYRRKM